MRVNNEMNLVLDQAFFVGDDLNVVILYVLFLQCFALHLKVLVDFMIRTVNRDFL